MKSGFFYDVRFLEKKIYKFKFWKIISFGEPFVIKGRLGEK